MAPVGAPAPAPSAAARGSAAPAASGAMASAPAPAMPADAGGSPAPSADAPAASAPAPLAGARNGAMVPAPAPMQEAAAPGPDGGSMAAMPQAPSPSPGSTPVYAAFINMRRAPAAAGAPAAAVAAPAPALDAAAAAPGPSAGAPAIADIMNTLIAKAGAFTDDKTLFLAGAGPSPALAWAAAEHAGGQGGRDGGSVPEGWARTGRSVARIWPGSAGTHAGMSLSRCARSSRHDAWALRRWARCPCMTILSSLLRSGRRH